LIASVLCGSENRHQENRVILPSCFSLVGDNWPTSTDAPLRVDGKLGGTSTKFIPEAIWDSQSPPREANAPAIPPAARPVRRQYPCHFSLNSQPILWYFCELSSVSIRCVGFVLLVHAAAAPVRALARWLEHHPCKFLFSKGFPEYACRMASRRLPDHGAPLARTRSSFPYSESRTFLEVEFARSL